MGKPPARTAEFDPDLVRDISVAVYQKRLDDASGPTRKDAAKMLEEDNDGGKKMRARAAVYDGLTRTYLRILNA